LQIKTSKVENVDGPLARLQKKPPDQPTVPPNPVGPLVSLPDGVEERVRNLEEHLGLEVGPTGGPLQVGVNAHFFCVSASCAS
jgi:hypothetical protein